MRDRQNDILTHLQQKPRPKSLGREKCKLFVNTIAAKHPIRWNVYEIAKLNMRIPQSPCPLPSAQTLHSMGYGWCLVQVCALCWPPWAPAWTPPELDRKRCGWNHVMRPTVLIGTVWTRCSGPMLRITSSGRSTGLDSG
jgi:hypothetical protein